MKKLLLLVLLLSSFSVFSQKEANIWYFGRGAGIDFNTSPPTAITDGVINTLEGCSTFSDSNGNLLFYTDGITVWNANHQVMNYTNGNPANNLEGNPSSSQSGIIVPRPNSPNIYYLFTVDTTTPGGGAPKGFNLYTIDMSLNGGLGEVEVNFTNLSPGSSEKVTSVKGDACNTFWVITGNGFQFQAYLIDENGVQTTPVTSNVSTDTSRRGYLKVSPDGSKLISANQDNNNAILYSFNNSTGVVSDDGVLLVSGSFAEQPYGVEFSRNSSKAYISTVSGFRQSLANPATTYKLLQFDLTAADIPASRALIHEQAPGATYPQGGFRGALQLGPDGKIYATIPDAYNDANGDATHLDVIENPNDDAADIVFTEDAIFLDGRLSTQGLPPFISSILLPVEIRDDDTGQLINDQDLEYCIGETKTLGPSAITGTSITYEWTFDDGTGEVVVATTQNLTLTNIQPTDAGDYKLKIELTDACGVILELEGQFTVGVFEAAAATQPTNIIFCDVDNDGFNSFDLATLKDAEILNGLAPATFEVAYFTSMADATANTNALTIPYTNPTAFSNQTIYARVMNRNAPSACFDVTSFSLAVTGLPVPVQPVDYEICDDTTDGDDTNGFVGSFLLNTKDTEILGTLDPAQYSVSYHTSLTGAQTSSSTDVIDKNNPYTNISANTQPIFVRVENVDNVACNDTSISFNLIVSALPTINATVELKQCDNDTDGFSVFNLNEAATDISTNYINETFIFYETLADAQANTNPIANPTTYTNQVVTTDTVWARAISSFGCYRIAEVTLTVSTTGIPATFQRTFNVCDDFLDIDGNDNANNDDTDGVTTFDFSSVTAEVRALFPVTQQLTITYYRNEADALAEQNAIADPANYRNIGYPNSQQIYVRVDSNLDNDCLGFGTHITLNVDPVPVANAVGNLELCDNLDDGDGFNGIVQTFNLDAQTPIILGTQNPADYTVTYHTSAADANSGANPIAGTNMYENIVVNQQTIFVRVTNNTTGCFTDHTTFDLIVNPLPVANFVADLEICDDDSDGSAQNGFSQSFNLHDQTAGVLGTQDSNQFTVSYHASLADAQAGILPLGGTLANPLPFSNSVPFSQIIYVRVFNSATGCANGISNFNVIVNAEPTTDHVSNLSYCDDNADGDDANGFVQNIDLDSQIPGILGASQDQDDFTVTFHESQADATSGANPLTSPYANTIANQQTIYVRVTNDDTGCVNDDFTFEVIINSLPDFTVTSPQIVCLNGPPLTIGVENPAAIYDYVWTDPSGNNSIGSQITITSGGLYTVTATTTNGTGCTRTREIQVNESIIATITDNDVTIVDDSDNNSISIDPTNLGIGDYEYALTDENGIITHPYQDQPLFENLEGGFFTILVRDKNGCGIASLDVSVVEFPKFFTPNNDDINDTWAIKGANSSFFPTSQIHIFNRFGKVVAKIDIDNPGWNGTFNGKTLPSDDYWFSIRLIDRNGILRERKGNFSLLRNK